MSTKEKEGSLIQHYLKLPLSEKIDMATKLSRGLFLRRKLNTKGWIIAGKGVKIAKQDGQIHLKRLCVLRDLVQISVRGKDENNPAILSIGYNTRISQRTKINVGLSVTIGDMCSIGWDCDIMDTSFHVVFDLEGKWRPVTEPVVIEDHVWLGCNTIVLKGITIGHHSVVAAGSVVVKDIPPYSLVGGNPAKVIKKISGWSRNPYPDEEP